jgi:hypothetical protein
LSVTMGPLPHLGHLSPNIEMSFTTLNHQKPYKHSHKYIYLFLFINISILGSVQLRGIKLVKSIDNQNPFGKKYFTKKL